MGNFRPQGRSGGFSRGRDRNFSGGGGFGRDRGFDRGRRNTEMFDATCSKCGKACQVPFKPTGSKPVLCSECFGQSDRGNGSKFQSSGSTVDLSGINAKLDKIIAILQELELDVVDENVDADESEEDLEN